MANWAKYGYCCISLRISYLLSTCWYFESHRIHSHYHNPFCLHPAPDHIQEKVGVVNTSNLLEERTHQQASHQQVKPKYNKRSHTNRRKGNPRASRQGNQKDCTTESQRTPPIQVHPTKTASKAVHQESQKQTKRLT